VAEIKAVKDEKPARETPGRSGITSPYFDLAASIAVAEAVHQRGGGQCSSEQLAAWLGYKSVLSGTYLTRVGAANKHFKLVESNGEIIALTERARKILSPVMPDDALNAKVEAFLDVTLFAKVYETYKGSGLPPEIGLKNLFLNTYKVLPDRVAQSVRVFLNSAEQAGFFTTTGDRSRLVKPSRVISPPTPAPATPNKEDTPAVRGAGGGGDGTMGVHSAIVGLLRELPKPGSPWSYAEQTGFLAAFTSMIKFIYPAKSEKGEADGA